jgi:hypothetical protein
LSDVVKSTLFNDDSLQVMRDSALGMAKPDAAAAIATAMIEAVR